MNTQRLVGLVVLGTGFYLAWRLWQVTTAAKARPIYGGLLSYPLPVTSPQAGPLNLGTRTVDINL